MAHLLLTSLAIEASGIERPASCFEPSLNGGRLISPDAGVDSRRTSHP
jgi:hypothetical protein